MNPGRCHQSSRFAACVEYDGAAFSGWQRQNGARTVQGVVEDALSFVADHPVAAVCAGRTDAGVHATGQVVHFDTRATRAPWNWLRGANTRLPGAVVLHWVHPVAPDFHARFRATRRRYRYVVVNRSVRPALLRGRVTFEYRPLDSARMADAARSLVGTHDFSAFRAAGCQAKNPVKTVHRVDVGASGCYLWLDIEADGFLHHMVRNIAGVLMAIGRGERPASWCAEVLKGRSRTAGGVTAPADGLYLTGVDYGDEFALPPAAPLPRFW